MSTVSAGNFTELASMDIDSVDLWTEIGNKEVEFELERLVASAGFLARDSTETRDSLSYLAKRPKNPFFCNIDDWDC